MPRKTSMIGVTPVNSPASSSARMSLVIKNPNERIASVDFLKLSNAACNLWGGKASGDGTLPIGSSPLRR